MSTKAIQVKKALETKLKALALVVSENVQVTYGFPAQSPERKWACVHEVRWRGTRWVTNRDREETFGVSVAFNVQLLAGTAEETEAKVVAMAAEFEDALKSDPGLGGLCITSSFEPQSLRSWPIKDAYEAQLDTEVTVTCRP